MAEAKNYNSQKIRGMECHTHAQESTLVHHLLVILENYTPLMTNIPPAPAIVTCRSRTTTPGMPRGNTWNYISQKALSRSPA